MQKVNVDVLSVLMISKYGQSWMANIFLSGKNKAKEIRLHVIEMSIIT